MGRFIPCETKNHGRGLRKEMAASKYMLGLVLLLCVSLVEGRVRTRQFAVI